MEKEEIYNRYLSQALTENDVDELKNILSTTEGREDFHKYMTESAEIGRYLKQEIICDEEEAVFNELVKKSEERLISSMTQQNSPEFYQKHAPNPKHIMYLGLLAVAAMLTVVGLFSNMNPAKNTILEKSVARVVELNGEVDYQEGDWLKPSKIHLRSGTMEIAFDSGARVLLQGETVLKLETARRAYLEKGRITALVPPEAVGFIVNTSQGSIVDLGTEFAVSVLSPDLMNVIVFDGLVEIEPVSGRNTRKLAEGEAVGVSHSGEFLDDHIINPDDFLRVKEREESLQSAYIYWPFDGRDRDQFKDRGNGGFGKFYDLFTDSQEPAEILGKHGQALNFNGQGQYLKSQFQGIEGGAPRTISFWVKIPPDMTNKNNYAMVAWGRVARSEKWQLGVNFLADNGVLGAIRTEFAEGYVIGTTDLRDGRWHHISSVFIGGESPNVATHVRHYVDGKLEGVSGFRPLKINTVVNKPQSEAVSLGKYINSGKRFFRGNLDEVYIFDRALTPDQIVRLRDEKLSVE